MTTTKITSPAFRWHGSKWRMYPIIRQFFSEHDVYVEPFGGSGSVLMQKPMVGLEVFNDLDGDVVNFFRILRTREDELVRAVQLTPYARLEHAQADHIVRSGATIDDPVERARVFFVLTEQGWGGKRHNGRRSWRRQKTGGPNVPNRARMWGEAGERLRAVAERMRSVFIESRPATDVIQQYDGPGSLFYVDPPYMLDARKRPDQGYQHEMTDTEHEELLSLLNAIQGTAIVSGGDHYLYNAMLANWHREQISVRALDARVQLTEVIWCNRPPQLRLI